MPRELEREIEALLQAKTEQIPLWHELIDRGLGANVQEGLELAFALLHVHRQIILRLAHEIDSLERPDRPRPT
jgi:hypothetical protein